MIATLPPRPGFGCYPCAGSGMIGTPFGRLANDTVPCAACFGSGEAGSVREHWVAFQLRPGSPNPVPVLEPEALTSGPRPQLGLTGPRVFVCSPFRPKAPPSDDLAFGTELIRNIGFAERMCRLALHRGFSPYAPHLFFPRFLDDQNAAERDAGIASGLAWLSASERLWIPSGVEWSSGMKIEIARAHELGIFVEVVDAGVLA